uniref:Uncharacterized protein n=1 Tax=Timema bartmani TaxID=61472 RepID=A0A7R9ESL2_9NEOP|nr:unnamed protein product [Timema bartmani]
MVHHTPDIAASQAEIPVCVTRHFTNVSTALIKHGVRVETCDLDDILKDVDEEKSSLLNSRVVTPGHPGTFGGFKCFPVYLGGAGYSAGHSTLSSPSLKVGMRMLVSVRIMPQKTWMNSTIYASLSGYVRGMDYD